MALSELLELGYDQWVITRRAHQSVLPSTNPKGIREPHYLRGILRRVHAQRLQLVIH